MEGQIFISYRREDTSWFVINLYERLGLRFSKENIFMDIDKLLYGRDFHAALEQALRQCDVLLAVIGKNWLGTEDKNGQDTPGKISYYVQKEIAAALQRGIMVLPILVDDAVMPAEDILPGDVKALLKLNGLNVSYTRFNADFDVLVKVLQTAFQGNYDADEKIKAELLRKQQEEAEQKREEEIRLLQTQRELRHKYQQEQEQKRKWQLLERERQIESAKQSNIIRNKIALAFIVSITLFGLLLRPIFTDFDFSYSYTAIVGCYLLSFLFAFIPVFYILRSAISDNKKMITTACVLFVMPFILLWLIDSGFENGVSRLNFDKTLYTWIVFAAPLITSCMSLFVVAQSFWRRINATVTLSFLFYLSFFICTCYHYLLIKLPTVDIYHLGYVPDRFLALLIAIGLSCKLLLLQYFIYIFLLQYLSKKYPSFALLLCCALLFTVNFIVVDINLGNVVGLKGKINQWFLPFISVLLIMTTDLYNRYPREFKRLVTEAFQE